MEGKFTKPVHLVAFGMFLMTLAGFFTVMHVGISARRAAQIQHGFAFRGAPEPEKSSFSEDFKRGGAIVVSQARYYAGGLFSGSESRAAAPRAYTASARRASIYEEERNGEPGGADPFVEFYEQNYGRGAGASYSAPAASWGGSASSWSGSGGSSTAGRGENSTAERAQESSPAAAEPEEEGSEAAETPGAPVFGGPLGKGEAPRQLQASLPTGAGPWQGLERPGELSGGGLSPAGAKGEKGGTLSGMPGRKDPGSLDGAGESARSGSQGSYNSKMAGGAAAAAAGAPGAVPDASKPKEVSADAGDSAGGGSSGSGNSGGSSGGSGVAPEAKAAAKAGDKPKTEEPKDEGYSDRSHLFAGAVEDQAFLKTVALERSKGAEVKYVTEDDAAGELDEALLKSGAAVTEPPAEKNFLAARLAPRGAKTDPEKFSDLSADRRKELKKEIHVFLKRIERRYGAMEDIVYTSCGAGRELCAEHGLTEGYITMKTRKGAKLLLGLKYVDKKWRPYTVGFTLPAAPRPQPPPVEESGQRDEESTEGGDAGPEAGAEIEAGEEAEE